MLTIISHPDCLLHFMGPYHPEAPARIKTIDENIKALKMDIKFVTAPLATKEQLALAHAKNYIEKLFAMSPQDGFVELDPDTIMNPYTINAALRAAGSVIHGVDLILEDKTETVFCNVRPPGHHAEHDNAMGFCFFNNIAVGVKYA